jgi:hypothetical protein
MRSDQLAAFAPAWGESADQVGKPAGHGLCRRGIEAWRVMRKQDGFPSRAFARRTLIGMLALPCAILAIALRTQRR